MTPFKLFASVILLLGALAVAACASPTGAAKPAEITVVAKDFTYELPAQMPAGLTTITLKNEGAEPHHAQFARVNDDVSDEQIMAALQQGPDAALALVTLPGGPAVIPPGQSTQVTIDLTPGRYLVLCFVPGHDGVPHAAKGMISMTQVVDSTARPAAPPKSDLTITLQDFSFTMPDTLKAGQQVWQVVNKGPQPHEIALIKLADGKTMDDVMAYMHDPVGPPPFEDAGGMQGLTAGSTGYFHVDLKPGVYVALCHIPDPNTGMAHEELGMVSVFTVN
ncbi:MAG: hypothetical protein V9H69_03920 [Anaerolineae bacterium]